nr:VOC family protein [Edaphobacter aggregans]
MAIDVRSITPLLAVFDMPTSIKFYCEGLGFEVVSSDGKPAPQFDWVLLGLNGAELMLNTAYDEDQRPPAPDPARIPAHKDVVIYFGCPDVAVYSVRHDLQTSGDRCHRSAPTHHRTLA